MGQRTVGIDLAICGDHVARILGAIPMFGGIPADPV